MDMNLGELWGMMRDSEGWWQSRGHKELDTTYWLNNNNNTWVLDIGNLLLYTKLRQDCIA